MTGAQHRFTRIIARCGEAVEIDSTPHVAIVTLLHPDAARRFLPDAVVEASRPIYAIMLRHDAAVSEAESVPVSVGSASATLLAVIDRRLRGAVLYRLVLAG